jgi:Mn2+/Fe2+ NRAMP family transporter
MQGNRFSKTLALFLPGIFLLGFNIGTGSVTSMAKAGATYGMSLLWTIVASCLATFLLITVYGRYTLVTGETALQAFRKHIHPAVGIFFIIALTAGVSGSVMGVRSTTFSGTAGRSSSNAAWRSSLPSCLHASS